MDRDFIWNNVFLDGGEEPIYCWDQMFVTYPVTFPVVNFVLVGTDGLYALADKIRKEAGYNSIDDHGWYDFRVSINGDPINATDNCITFLPVLTGQDDDETEYHIPLDGEEPMFLWRRLDEQARECWGQGCAELLKEAERDMCGHFYPDFDEDEDIRSVTGGDYGAGSPWNAPGMSARDFI